MTEVERRAKAVDQAWRELAWAHPLVRAGIQADAPGLADALNELDDVSLIDIDYAD